MKVLLLEDVYKLGRAGDVKKVADGYGRNYLIPQGLAVLATPGAMKRADYIREVAAERRAQLNLELGSVAERFESLKLFFPVKAGETGRLYGSVTPTMIADAINSETNTEIDRKQIDTQPIKQLGVHRASIRLTMDLVPEIVVVVHREGEPPETVMDIEITAEDVPVEEFAELQAELDAIEAEAEAAEEVVEVLEEVGDSAETAEFSEGVEGVEVETPAVDLVEETEPELTDEEE
ncbi:MAG: 50S ribosomal protein L9 [Anaerolineales bacterium]|nr:50S ribosomal protein L9 [Anaerolineales bacterium]